MPEYRNKLRLPWPIRANLLVINVIAPVAKIVSRMWIWPIGCNSLGIFREDYHLSPTAVSPERRRWQRLRVPVPMFIRGVDERGKEFLEFSTALNISAGGALLVSHRFLRSDSKVFLEIPPAPFPKEKAKARSIKARVVQVRNSDRFHLCNLEFSRPLTIN